MSEKATPEVKLESEGQAETTITTTPTELMGIVVAAVHAASTAVEDRIAEVENRVSEIQVQAQPTEPPAEALSEKPAIDPIVDAGTPPEDTLPTPVKEAIATEVQTEIARVTASQATEPTAIPSEVSNHASIIEATHQPLNNSINVIKTQSMVIIAILFLIILGLIAYIAVDKAYIQPTQIVPTAPASEVPSFSIYDVLNSEKGDQQTIPDLDEAIIKKQKDNLELKPISDSNVMDTVSKTINESDTIAELIQSHVDKIKRTERISDRDAVAKGFLVPEIVPAVIAELPIEIQTMPKAEEFVKDKLRQISNSVKRFYDEKDIRR